MRAIRKSLGLSQVQAGELLGGGPRAFTRYEAGTLRPRASVVRLLRVLEATPDAIATLRGGVIPPSPTVGPLPFEVTGKHIELLTDRTLPVLLRRLLSAEAQAQGLPEHGIHVAVSITTPDGGEDGRIEWTKGPSRTPFLPSRFCQFQLKAGQVSPSDAAREVVSRSGVVKPMVQDALEAGAHYIMLCSRPYTHQQIEAREERIRAALRGAGMVIADDQVDFRDAGQVADWVNRHPSVAAWAKEWTQPGTVGPFRSWTHWAPPRARSLPLVRRRATSRSAQERSGGGRRVASCIQGRRAFRDRQVSSPPASARICRGRQARSERQLTVSRSPFPALNNGTFEAAIAMLSPVRGFRPCRAGRSFTEKVPNPATLTVSPLARASLMDPSTALTAVSASAFDSEASAATQVDRSDLFTRILP